MSDSFISLFISLFIYLFIYLFNLSVFVDVVAVLFLAIFGFIIFLLVKFIFTADQVHQTERMDPLRVLEWRISQGPG